MVLIWQHSCKHLQRLLRILKSSHCKEGFIQLFLNFLYPQLEENASVDNKEILFNVLSK